MILLVAIKSMRCMLMVFQREPNKDPIERAIQKYKSHLSIQIFKETFGNKKTFSFDFVSSETILKEVVSVATNKATHSNDVPTKIVNEDADLFSNCKSNACNESIISCNFMSVLKLVDVTSVHKNKSWLKKFNYRPISLLPNISKIFERRMSRQI